MKTHLIKMAVVALLCGLTFLPYIAFLRVLSYSHVSDDEALELARPLRLQQGATLTIMGGDDDGKEIPLSAGSDVLYMAVYDLGLNIAPPSQVDAETNYVLRLADGRNGFAKLPFIAADSLLCDTLLYHDGKVLAYMYPTYESRSIAEIDSVIDSKAKADDGFFKKVSRNFSKGRKRIAKILYKYGPSVTFGGFMNYPRFSGWSLYNLPEFMRTGIIGGIFSFLMMIIGGFIFWPLIFLLAKDIAILPSFIRALDNNMVVVLAWIIYLLLNIPIMMWGMTSILGWVFFLFALVALFPAAVDQEDKSRCQKCHRRYIDIDKIDVKHGPTTVETTTTTWGDGDKEVKKSSTTKRTATYKATCPHCGHVRVYEEDDSFTREWVSKNRKRYHSRIF